MVRSGRMRSSERNVVIDGIQGTQNRSRRPASKCASAALWEKGLPVGWPKRMLTSNKNLTVFRTIGQIEIYNDLPDDLSDRKTYNKSLKDSSSKSDSYVDSSVGSCLLMQWRRSLRPASFVQR
jgi:hypothetical protein